MPTISGWNEWPNGDCAVCVGVFDGVHRGHAEILEITRAAARRMGGAFCVLTFDRHPAELLAPQRAPRMITSLEQRVKLLDGFRPDVLAVLPFDSEMANTEPEDFVQKLTNIGTKTLVMGRGAAFGRGARGNSEWLSGYAPTVELETIIAQPVMFSQNIVSSTAVRAAISAGNLPLAEELLGHALPAYEGNARGNTVFFDERRIFPPHGEYEAQIFAGGCSVRAVGKLMEGPSFEVKDGNAAAFKASGAAVSVSFIQAVRGGYA